MLQIVQRQSPEKFLHGHGLDKGKIEHSKLGIGRGEDSRDEEVGPSFCTHARVVYEITNQES